MRWQLLILVLALAAIAVLLLSQQPIIEAIIPEPSTGGIYAEGLVGELQRLNPALDYYNAVDRDVDRLIFSSLIRFDDRGNPVPDLVERWGVSLDGKAYNLTLWEGALWHDGAPVTTEDVAFTIDLLRHPDMPTPPDVRALWEAVEVNVLDEHNMQLLLDDAFAPFIEQLTFGVLPQHLLGNLTPAEVLDAPFNLSPVGSGPYRFEQLTVEDGEIVGVVLTAFGDYYLEPPFIDQVIFRYYQSAAAALIAYQNDELDGIGRITPDSLAEALQEPSLNVYTGRLPQLTTIMLNLDDSRASFFQELELRQALMYALNRQQMVAQVLDGQAILADGPIFPGTWAYDQGLPRIGYDPDMAVSILKQAGYVISAEAANVREKDGQQLRFELLHPDTETHTAIAEIIQSNWQEIGVRVDLQAVDYAELLGDYLQLRDYQAALVDLSYARSPDPDPYPFWHQAESPGGQNYSGWNDRRASEYLEKARVSVNLQERQRLYSNFQEHFSREVPALLLFYPTYSYGVDARVQGISIGPLFDPSDRLANLTSWFLVAGGPAEEEQTALDTPESQ